MNEFKKEERLCSRTLLLRLIKEGSSFLLYPFRVTSLHAPLPSRSYPVQVMISVSRRRFKRAVDRNRVKRLIREAYRKQKSRQLYEPLSEKGQSLALLLSYVGKDILPAAEIEKKLILVFKRLQQDNDQKGA